MTPSNTPHRLAREATAAETTETTKDLPAQHVACENAHRWLLAHEWKRDGDYFVKIGHCETMGVDAVALIVGAALAAIASDRASRDLASLALPQLEEQQRWMPISSAPKDGTRVLLGRFAPGKDRDGLQCVDWWRTSVEKQGFTGWGKFNAMYWPATHWQPLPKPPTQDTTTQEKPNE